MRNFTNFIPQLQKGLKRTLFKNAIISAFLLGISMSGFAGSGLFDAYAILSINGGGNTYRQYSSFQGWSIGSFTYGTNNLILNGAQNKTYKNGGSNVTGGQLGYRVYLTGGTVPGFSFINLPFGENYPTPGDQRWETNNANINLLSGRSPGNYTLEVFWQAYSSDGDHFYSDFGNNFKATFSITCNTPAAPTGSLTILNSTCASACTVSGGSISIGTVAGSEGTLEYSTNNGVNWSSTLPSYSGGLTILASVINAGGCRSNTTQVGVTVAGSCITPSAPGIGTITHPSVCNSANGSVQLTGLPSGSWTINQSPGGAITNGSGTSTTITGLASGDYSFTVTNASGCTSVASGTATLTAVVSCLDGSITGATSINCFSDFTVKLTAAGSGGSAPYTYLWSTGQSGAVINNAGAGTYSVTITDGIGQTKVVNHIITGPTAVSATFVVTNQKCEDPAKGTIVATAFGGTPGYEYALDFGAWQNSGTFTIVPTGWHTINIKDENGCQGKVSALVTKLASSMTLSAVRTGISSCGGTGTITATADGGVAPYQYKLGDAGTYQSSGTFTGLAAGTYKVIAKDNIGCTVSRNYIISDNGKDPFESNNAIGAAKIIGLNTNVVARIGTATDQDWFKFNSGSSGDFDITLSHGTVNYNLQLFTNLGALVTPVSQTGNTISYTGLEFASTYRIQITGAQSFDCYNLMVAPAPPVITGAEMLTSTTVAPDELKAQAFPNPHNGSIILQVESPVSGKGSIVLYDLQGRTMVTREENLRAGTNQVRFSNLQPINYFYRVMVGGKSTSGKVFKQ